MALPINMTDLITRKVVEKELFLLSQTVPFDDRPNFAANSADLKPALISDYLYKVKSELYFSALQRPLTDLATDFLKELKLVEGRNTGVPTILRTMQQNGSPAPLFQTDSERTYFTLVLPMHHSFLQTTEATTEVKKIVLSIIGEMNKTELRTLIGLKNDEHFRKNYLAPALESGLIEMTLPNSPRSPTQKYRLTAKGFIIKEKLLQT